MAGGLGSLKVDVVVVRLGLDGMLDVGREGVCLCFVWWVLGRRRLGEGKGMGSESSSESSISSTLA